MENLHTRSRMADGVLIVMVLALLSIDVAWSLLSIAGVGYAFVALSAAVRLRERRFWSVPAILCCLAVGAVVHLDDDPMRLLRATLAVVLVGSMGFEWWGIFRRRRVTQGPTNKMEQESARQLLATSTPDPDSAAEAETLETAGLGLLDSSEDHTRILPLDVDSEDSLEISSTASGDDSWVEHSASRSSLETVDRLRATGAFSESTLDAIEALARKQSQVDMHLADCRAARLLTKFQLDCIRGGREDDLCVEQYTVQSVLGRGSMGVVYRAIDRARDRVVALKMYRNPGDQLARIRREMVVLEKLAHPNIVIAFELGKSGSRYFIAMEYIEGKTLQQVMKRSGPLTPSVALPMMLQVAVALEQAHARGILHRDIKPGNIMLMPSGDCKVLDLGISLPPPELRDLDADQFEGPLVCGTVGFMSPEQARGKEELDARSDIFAIGCTLQLLLTGEFLIPGATFKERLRNTLRQDPWNELDRSQFSDSLCDLVARLTARDPDERFQSMGELLPELRREIRQMGLNAEDRAVHVLIVEESRSDGMLAERLLERSNHSLEIRHAGGFAAACDAAWIHCESSSLPLIVLVDLHLPDSVPMETAERIGRLAGQQVHVIAMADGKDTTLRGICLRSGAVDYLCKESTSDAKFERVIFSTFGRLPSPDRLAVES